MDSNKYFVVAGTPEGAQFSGWVELVQVNEPPTFSDVFVQTRAEYLAEHGGYLSDEHEWVITFEQNDRYMGIPKSSKARLVLSDDTLRSFVDAASPRLRATPIERDPNVEQQLEDEYAECDG